MQISVFIALVLIVFSLQTACTQNTGDSTNNEQPSACKKYIVNNNYNTEIVSQLSVEELLVLQKCGLSYHPTMMFFHLIANHKDYAVPILLQNLQKQSVSDDRISELNEYYIIYTISYMTEISRHKELLLKDKKEILETCQDTMSKMKNREIKQNTALEIDKIKKFFKLNE